MVVKADQERVRTLLRDTITLLCKNGLEYHDKFSVDAVIGVTVDEGDVFLVSMNDIIWSERSRLQQATSSTTEPDGARRKKRRKRKRVKTEAGEEASSDGSDSSESDDGAKPPKRLPVVSKQEPISEPEDVDEDIVVIKEELDTWGADSFSGANPHLGDPNTDPAYYGGDQSYGDMGYHDQSWPSTTSTPQRGQYQMGRTATVTSASPGTSGGDMAQDPGLGAQQLQGSKISCPVCQKSISSSTYLRQHLLWHQGKYPFYCSECGKGFMNKGTYRGHMARHTGVKEFNCPVCAKPFAYKHDLTRHIKITH